MHDHLIQPLEPRRLLAGTLVRDLNPDGDGNPHSFIEVAGLVYFYATDSAGPQLWRTDGTERGTFRLTRGAIHAADSTRVAHEDESLYFLMRPSRGGQIWRTDGTAAGTVMLHQATASITDLAVLNGQIFFSTFDSLWATDGTAGGTRLLRSFGEAPGIVGERVRYPTVAGGVLYFTAPDGSHGRELWASDGTVSGTRLVKRFDGSGEGPQELTEYRGRLYFTADDGTHGYELWMSDGTAAGTTLVRDTWPGGGIALKHFTVTARGLFFTSYNAGKGELWRSDGTMEGTIRLLGPDNASNSSTAIGGVVDAGGTLYFTRHVYSILSRSQISTLWRSDGTQRGTVPVAELPRLPEGFDQQATAIGRGVYFKTPVGDHVELWYSDGTPGGTKSVMSLGSYALARDAQLEAASGTLFFPNVTQASGRELWRLGRPIVSRAHVSGIVFNDLDGDGARETGEGRLSGFRVFLDANANGKLESGERWTRTDSAGNYEFVGVVPGTYHVRITSVAGFGATTPLAFKFKAAAGDAVRRHFGQWRGGVISGSIFRDNNRNGRWDSAEGILAGWRVFVDANNNGLLDAGEHNALSDARGHWKLRVPEAGTYVIRVVQPPGWRLITPSGGYVHVSIAAGQTASQQLFGQKRLV